MGRVLLGGLVGGIVVFVWSAVAHIALPLGEMGMRQLPDEGAVVEAFRNTIKEPGFYFFPGIDRGKPASEAEQKAWQEKLKQGPTGILVIHPEGGEAMSPKQLGSELASNFVAALVAAFILTHVRAGYFTRVLVVSLLAVFSIASLVVSYWIWYGFPTEYVLGETITEVVGWFLAGLAMAAIVRPALIKHAASE
jgi:hypothetical protein